jgi:hypothetical protein
LFFKVAALDERHDHGHHEDHEGHEWFAYFLFINFVLFACSFENTGWRGLGQFKQNPSIPSFQHGVLESRPTRMSPDASLRIWMPAIHAGMTKLCIYMFCERA